MTEHKFVVIYPMPSDVESFEKIYSNEHVPMAVKNFKGKTKIIASKVNSSFDKSETRYYRYVEVHFPSREALESCMSSKEAQDTFAHGAKISSGGKPLILTAESETFNF